jgi:prepilin-type N-terminal cleavage/methylation domain-containing protein
MKNHLKRGFTLIELMVVITIIAILAGLLITLIPEVMRKAKLADTSSRMNSVHTGMALIGQNEGSATFRMQQMLEYRTTGTVLDGLEPGLSGIFTFGPPNSNATGADVGLPTVGTRPSLLAAPPPDPYGAWGYRGRGHLAFPWGKKFPDTTAVTGTQTTVLMGPERFMLRHMSPFNTRKLLKLANVLPTKASDATWPEKQYMTNRKTSEQWNDAWGHPLVVASVLYQPTFQNGPSLSSLPGWTDGAWPTMTGTTPVDPVSATVTASSAYLPKADASTWSATQKSTPPTADDEMPKQAPTKKMLLDHMNLYRYNRSVYIAVAAVGPSARASDDDLKSTDAKKWGSTPNDKGLYTGTLDVLWNQANNVCQQAKKAPFDSDWTELSWDNPPWQGNKYDYLTSSKKMSDFNYKDNPTKALIYDGIAPYKGKEEHCLLSAPLEYK